MNSGGPGDVQGSLKKRFGYKLFTNLIGLLLGIVFAGLVPRALGPKTYGDYNFLTNFFTQLIGFLDMRSSTYMYTTLSSHRGERRILALYLWLAAGLSLVVLGFTAFAVFAGFHDAIWPGQGRTIIFLAAGLTLLFWYSELMAKVCDALGLTVRLEKTKIANQLSFFVLLLALVYSHKLGLYVYVAFQAAVTLSLLSLIGVYLYKARVFSGVSFHPSRLDAREGLRSIFAYSHPIFIYSLLGILANYLDRWLLQRFGGSAEQGFFSFALNISLVFNVFINAIHPLVMREFSIAFASSDTARVAELFNRLVPAVYTLTAIVSCFIIAHASECVDFIGGASYGNAKQGFLVMSFLPIIHNYSILSGSVLWASNRTKLIRNLGLALFPVGILATVGLIGPAKFWGLELGSLGLAYKTVAMEFIAVNIVLWFNCRILPLNFAKLLFHQVSTVAVLVGIAFLCKAAIFRGLAALNTGLLTQLLLGGVTYLVAVAAVFWYFPSLLGLRKAEILEVGRQLYSRVTARKPKES